MSSSGLDIAQGSLGFPQSSMSPVQRVPQSSESPVHMSPGPACPSCYQGQLNMGILSRVVLQKHCHAPPRSSMQARSCAVPPQFHGFEGLVPRTVLPATTTTSPTQTRHGCSGCVERREERCANVVLSLTTPLRNWCGVVLPNTARSMWQRRETLPTLASPDWHTFCRCVKPGRIPS